MIENGTLLQNRYLIERKIGAGGMGAVYLATDKRFDNHVAIKETFYREDEFGEAFEREARLLNALQHPVLPHVSDYFTENGGHFIVMQFIDGEDLCDALKRDGAFPLADVLRWTEDLLDALDYLHAQTPPVIHRDIKPHNLKLNARGNIMLLDFGLAKLNKKDATEISVFGYSRTYSPLEQIQGTGTDAHSDIFALGATVYHLLTGTPPINALTRAAAIVGGNPDPLRPANEIRPEIPEGIANVLNEALALDARNRFVSAKAMRQAFRFAAGGFAETGAAEKSAASIAAAPALGGSGERQTGKTSTAEALNALPPKSAPVAPPRSSAIIVDMKKPGRVRRESNGNRFVWAAAAVLLFFGITTAFYFGSGESDGQSAAPTVNANANRGKENRESLADARKKSTEKTEKSKTDESGEWKPESSNGKTPDSATVSTRRKNQSSDAEEPSAEDEISAEPVDVTAAEIQKTESETPPKLRRKEKPVPDVSTEEQFQELKRKEKQNSRESNDDPGLD
ncbi:MAG TPA: protein kinase [Pyrinomonadaceae bacterium]|jgi:serine/threonine protein kinase